VRSVTTRGSAEATRHSGNLRVGIEIAETQSVVTTRPDPEMAEKPQRRRVTPEYKVRSPREVDSCPDSGEIGTRLRRERWYSGLEPTGGQGDSSQSDDSSAGRSSSIP
jgi:hypothetical protein